MPQQIHHRSDTANITGNVNSDNDNLNERIADTITKIHDKHPDMRYYILDQNISAEEMSHIVRGHWEIENNLHWVLDVHFREDACKVKVKKAMQNLSLIRKICYNLIKLDKRFDKKKRMTYKKMSMLYNCHLEYIEDLIFERIEL